MLICWIFQNALKKISIQVNGILTSYFPIGYQTKMTGFGKFHDDVFICTSYFLSVAEHKECESI